MPKKAKIPKKLPQLAAGTAPKKKPRKVLTKIQLKPLTVEGVKTVVKEAFPQVEMTADEVLELQHVLNDNLRMLAPRLRTPTVGIKGISSAVDKLNYMLKGEANLLSLAATASARNRRLGYHDRDVVHPDDIKAAVELKAQIEMAKSWLDDHRAKKIVAAALKPEAGLQEIVGHLLPNIFELTFVRMLDRYPDLQPKFGSGESGPGARFVFAVLREAGVYSEAERPSGNLLAKKARKRVVEDQESNIKEAIAEQAKKRKRQTP